MRLVLLLHFVRFASLAQAAHFPRMQFEFSNLCLAPLKGFENTTGVSVHQYNCSGGLDQEWEALPTADKQFMLKNKLSNLCLDTLNDRVMQKECDTDADSQEFLYHSNRGRTGAIKQASAKFCLAIKGSSKDEGAELWLQRCSSAVYQVIHTELPPAGSEVLPRMHFMFSNNSCLSPWDGAPVAVGIGVRLYPCSRLIFGQQWEKIPAPGGFLVRNRRSLLCLDGRAEGNIRMQRCKAEDYQVFTETDNWGMMLASTRKCLGIRNTTKQYLYLQECEDGPQQRIDTDPAPPPAPPGPPRPHPIRFAFSNKCLDGAGRAAITQVECTGAELWDKVLVYGGGFLLKNTNSGDCAAVQGSGRGAEVAERPCNSKDKSQVFEDAPGGGLKVKHSGKCLAMEDGSKVDGKHLQQQKCNGRRKQRILQKAEEVSLRIPSMNLCIEVLRNKPNKRALLGARRCHGQENQRWDKLDVPGGGFKLRNVCSGKCMHVEGALLKDGVKVSQYPCSSEIVDNEVFTHTSSGTLEARHSGKCVSPLTTDTRDMRQKACNVNTTRDQIVEISPLAFVTPREEKYPPPPQRLDGEPPVSDYTLLPPSGSPYMSLCGPGSGHTERRARSNKEPPLFYPYEARREEWWDNLLNEMVQGRMPAIMVSSRGTGEGNMNPSDTPTVIEGMERNGLTPDLMKIALFLDTANWPIRARQIFGVRGIDLASHEQFAQIIWSENVRPFFDALPRERWFRISNRPVIQTWGLNPAMPARNHFGQLSERYTWLADQFEQVFGERPYFVMSSGSLKSGWGDATFFDNPDLLGINGWFNDNGWTMPRFHDVSLGTAIASFHHDHAAQSTVRRNDGQIFFNAVSNTSHANFTIIESWTNLLEGMAIYRSEAAGWPTPNVYINHLQRFNDPEALTLRLECEAADRFVDTTPGNEGGDGPPRFKEGVFRYSGDLDIFKLEREPGWAVGWTTPGESITHVNVYFGKGWYRFTLKYACTDPQVVEFEVGGVSQGEVALPATGGEQEWRKIHLATGVEIEEGTANVSLAFKTGNVSVDWVFVKKEPKPTPAPATDAPPTVSPPAAGSSFLDWLFGLGY